jgi:hypothetical protein
MPGRHVSSAHTVWYDFHAKGMRMVRSNVKTYRYKIGKNHYIVINIRQQAAAKANVGNVLASNAANVQIFSKQRGNGIKRRR